MKALVTGGAGFIGSHLSERLLEHGAEVVALDCFTDYYPRALKERNLAALRARPGYRLVESTIADADLPALLDGVTHVFHLAAQAGVRKSWGRDFQIYTTLNVDATQILLEACVGLPIERVVYASSSSVYGDEVTLPMKEDVPLHPVSPYGVTKLAAEHLCHLYFVNHGVPDGCRCATSPSMARGSARTWALTGFSRRFSTIGRSPSTATGCRRGTSPLSPTPRGRRTPPPSAACPAASTILGVVRACRCGRCST